MIQCIFYLATLLVFLAHLFPLLPSKQWFIRALDFPRVQVIVITLVYSTVTYLYVSSLELKIILLALSFGGIIIDLYRIIPYTRLHTIESKQTVSSDEQSLKIISSNVYINNKNHDQIIQLMHEQCPDIFLLLEADNIWREGVKTLEKDYPHTKLLAKDNTYGMLLYSKLEFSSVKEKYLVDEDIPSIFAKVILPNSEEVELICLHPRPPRPKAGSSLQRDGELMNVAQYVKSKSNSPVLVIGDFNDVAWSHTTRLFKRLSGLLDPRVGRGFYNTFHVKSKLLRFPLDHVFHSHHLQIDKLSVLPDIGSDHFPIMASFKVLSADKNSEGSSKNSSSDDEEEMQKTRAKAKSWDGSHIEIKKSKE